MGFGRKALLSLSVFGVVGAGITVYAAQGAVSGPIARYDMRAGTISGMGAMGAGSMMGAMFGGGRGGNNVQHELLLRLGSSTAPSGGPKADHFMPPVAKLGKSVALTTPREEKETVDELPQKPKGRILIFWGCGATAPKGQPVVIDFSKLAAGQIPPGLWTTTITRDYGPTMANSRTFGRWPSEDRKFVKPDSSLIGAHKVISNYSPEIAFTLSKDFMAPLNSSTRTQAGGATVLSWNSVPTATGYLAFLFGGKQGPNGEMGDMVMWTSSDSRQFGGGLSDWLSPGQVANLVTQKVVMAPTTTSCLIPQEVKAAAPDFRVGTLTAFGPQEDFSYPPKPAAGPWKLEWTARIRHRSMTTWMEAQGMSMGGMGAMRGEDEGSGSSSGQKQQCKRKGGLGGMLGGALGGGSGC